MNTILLVFPQRRSFGRELLHSPRDQEAVENASSNRFSSRIQPISKPAKMPRIALYTILAACILGLLILFSTYTLPYFTTDKPLSAFGFGNGRPSHFPRPHPAVPPSGPHDAGHGKNDGEDDDPMLWKEWVFDYKRDSRKYGLSEEQCLLAFPRLYEEVDRAVEYRRKIGNITREDVKIDWRNNAIMRVMVRDGQLYIIHARDVDRAYRPRNLATLNSINRALVAYPGSLPDVEFSITHNDNPLVDKNGKQTTWAYARLPHQESLWLMPDFGFWGWPGKGTNSYAEHQAVLDEEEPDFLDKTPKLVWRGGIGNGGRGIRQKLIKESEGKTWSDVAPFVWKNEAAVKQLYITMRDHCNYMFTAQTEGNTYSGRLKLLLNCHSIVMSHELRWVEHFHPLLQASGPNQNYVQLQRNFSDLPETIERLLEPSVLHDQGQRIADNARRTFRERYLTPAAEACYWRALIRGWASVQGFEPERWVETEDVSDGGKKKGRIPRGVPFESYAIMEATEWSLPVKERHLCVDGEKD